MMLQNWKTISKPSQHTDSRRLADGSLTLPQRKGARQRNKPPVSQHSENPTPKHSPSPGPTALQMPLREVQGPIYYDQHGQIQGGGQTFIYQPFTATDLLNQKHHTTSFKEKPQAD
jgi:hypothetical protein